MADDMANETAAPLQDQIASERLRIRTAAGQGILDLKAIERLKGLLRDQDVAEAAVPKGEAG